MSTWSQTRWKYLVEYWKMAGGALGVLVLGLLGHLAAGPFGALIMMFLLTVSLVAVQAGNKKAEVRAVAAKKTIHDYIDHKVVPVFDRRTDVDSMVGD
jgi:predicted lipid-binding transport protein (Tim44 family)